MEDQASETTSWYFSLSELSIIPREYHYIVRVISSFFITLALAPIVPIALVVLYDLGLWLWRHAAFSWRARSALRSETAASPPNQSTHGGAQDGSLEPQTTNGFTNSTMDGLADGSAKGPANGLANDSAKDSANSSTNGRGSGSANSPANDRQNGSTTRSLRSKKRK